MQTGAGQNVNKILVFSASGSVGFQLCQCLLQQNLPFKACIRKGTKNDRRVQELNNLKNTDTKGLLEIVELDWNQPDTIKSALKDCDRVFLKTPIGQCESATRTFVDCLKDVNNIKWIVDFSVYDAEERKVGMGEEFCRGEQILQTCNVPYCIVRPSFLFSNFIVDAKNIKERGELCRPLGNACINIVSDMDVAEAVCKLLLNEQQYKSVEKGKAYHLFAKECINMNDFAQNLSKELGKQVTYREVSEDEFTQCLRDFGINRDGIDSYLGLMKFAKEGGYNKTQYNDLQNILGRDPCSIRECIQRDIKLLQ